MGALAALGYAFEEARVMKPHGKHAQILAIAKLLDVPGTRTSWEQIAPELHKLPLRILNGLRYRIEGARAESYEDGALHGEPSK